MSPQPRDESVVGGQPAEVRQRQKTALIALISKDKTISVLLAKRFSSRRHHPVCTLTPATRGKQGQETQVFFVVFFNRV